MGVVVSPSGGSCEHVDVFDDATGAHVGRMPLADYWRIIGVPQASWTPQAQANRETLQGRAAAALTANDTYLAIGSPTNAQNLAQIRALTRECSGVIRLLLSRLETTAGT